MLDLNSDILYNLSKGICRNNSLIGYFLFGESDCLRCS
jgi:hypothetical protein